MERGYLFIYKLSKNVPEDDETFKQLIDSKVHQLLKTSYRHPTCHILLDSSAKPCFVKPGEGLRGNLFLRLSAKENLEDIFLALKESTMPFTVILIDSPDIASLEFFPFGFVEHASDLAFSIPQSSSAGAKHFFVAAPLELIFGGASAAMTRNMPQAIKRLINRYRLMKFSAVEFGALRRLVILVKLGRRLEGDGVLPRIARLTCRTIYELLFSASHNWTLRFPVENISDVAFDKFGVKMPKRMDRWVIVLKEDLEPVA